MKRPRVHRLDRAAGFLAGLGMCIAGLAAGCNDNEFGPELRRPNRPPVTVLASGPPDSTSSTDYRVHLYWSGSDADGIIDHYDFILVDHPAIEDSIVTGSPQAPNRVVIEVPALDDPRWTATSLSDTILVTRADTLRRDPAPPPGGDSGALGRHNEFMRRQSFERWHTFFVRAVDNEGLVDPTPDYRSFNSRNLAPVVRLDPPVSWANSEFRGPPTIVFNWSGSDPLGDRDEIEPIASRWVILTTIKDAGGYRGLPDTLYRLPPSAWSPWRAWSASDGSGRRAVVRNLRPAGEPGAGYYLFAVQAMDEAGAVTPVFDWKTAGKNNVTPVFVTGDIGPTMTLRDRYLGTYRFTGASRPLAIDIAAGQPVSFCWAGDASSYGGNITGYRFGWDLRNPDDDSEWEQTWSETATCAPTRSFSSGTHIFFLEARDNAESTTRTRIELSVRQVTRRRDLLIVDDSFQPQGDTDPAEGREDTRWLGIVDSLRAERTFAFDAVRDVYDVREKNRLPPPLSLVFDYKTVVWNVVASSGGAAISEIARFSDPFSLNASPTSRFNYLNIYLENGGEMWVTGQQPTFTIWPLLENRPIERTVPANLTNWAIDEHPAEDSVGTTSFLYRMGVEAVDLGSGGYVPAPRYDRLEQGCIGFRRAGGPSGGTLKFASTPALDHSHELVVLGVDIEQAPAAGVTYTTDSQAQHTHAVHLTETDLRTLGGGGRVTVETALSDVPEPHTHRYEIEDRIGLWGAPAFLYPEVTWPQPPFSVNPYRSRVNVEIYNMPTYLTQQTPVLSPPVERVLALYEFASATPTDGTRGILYPRTADGQPAIILAKRSTADSDYSRAYCGFEPWRLSFASHRQLAAFILLRHMRLGLVDDPLVAAPGERDAPRSPRRR